MDRRLGLTTVRIASVAIVLLAIVYQLIWLVNENRFDPSRFFAFFTIQSNLFGAAASTFFVVILFLSGADVQLELQWVDFVLHKLFPVIVVLDWLVDPPTTRLGVRDALIWLAYPLVWVTLTLIRGAADGWYPYPFLDAANGGYASVAVYFVTILVFFLVIGSALIWLGNWRGRSSVEGLQAAS